MNQKLIGDIRALAESILKDQALSDIDFYKEKAKHLYEQLTIARYLQENAENELGLYETGTSALNEELTEPATEKIKDIVAQMPEESVAMDTIIEQIITPKHSINEIEVFAAEFQQIPEFERKQEENTEKTPSAEPPAQVTSEPPKKFFEQHEKQKSINETLNKSTTIGLNDRIAFTKHLFNGNSEDYTRVLSQISTLNSASEITDFIENIVKPDYDWKGKEFYVEKFISIFTKRFE